jgi:hypothetical protein
MTTTRTQRRQAQQNAVAKILLGDPSATWSNLSTFIVSPLFPEPLCRVGNASAKQVLTERLSYLLENVRALPADGKANPQIAEAMAQHPRQSTSPKKRKTTG